MKPNLNLVRLQGVPIYQQLQWEEAILRAGSGDYLILNSKAPPAIVMGISGKPEQLIHLDRCQVPIIRRYSGGGTVYVDQNTLFISWLCDGTATPEQLMRWSAELYAPVFNHPLFALRERDYVFGDKKFGGNAQYIMRNRWCHHSTLLWDYCPTAMETLRIPSKAPAYRQNRPHSDFCCRLLDYYPTPETILDRLLTHLHTQYTIIDVPPEALHHFSQMPHRKATELVTV
jgi:lipoate---protein ligase